MDRRAFLGAFAATVTVPGCLGDSPGPASGGESPTSAGTPTTGTESTTTGTGTPTTDETPSGTGTKKPSPTGTAVSVADSDFVREAFVVPEVAAPNSPDSFGVYGDRDEQFVVALLDGSPDTAPAVEDVALAVDGERFQANADVSRQWWGLFDYGTAYAGPDDPEGWVAVRLSNPLETTAARLTWPGGAAELGAAALDRLARPPATFAVRSFEVTETAEPGETVTVRATVENTGDVDGTFVAALNRAGPWIAYTPEATPRLSIDAGETRTWRYEHELDVRPLDEARTMRLHLHWRDDSLSREVTVTPDGTPTAATTDG